MRKNSIGAALALALSLGVASVATAQGGNRPERPRAAQDGAFRRGAGGPDAMLLRGITLTKEQQERVAALRASQRPERVGAGRARGEKGGGAAMAGAPRQRGDTAGMGARRAAMQKRGEQHITALRAILTADQRVQFDRNVAELKARRAERGDAGAPGQSGGRRPRAERQRGGDDGRPPMGRAEGR